MKPITSGSAAGTSARPFTLKLTVGALAAAGVLSGASVWAQDAAKIDTSSVVTVTGVRKSAQSA
jgi:iron complex outermembrane receptor protein